MLIMVCTFVVHKPPEDRFSRIRAHMILIYWPLFLVPFLIDGISIHIIDIAPIAQLRTCVIKTVTFKGGHLLW